MNSESIEIKVAKLETISEQLEADVSKIWDRVDSLKNLMIATLSTAIAAVIGIIGILVTK